MPKSADRLSFPEWQRTGKKGVIEKAKERMEQIMKTHKVKPLSEKQDAEIDRILGQARKYYKEKGLL